MVLLDARVDLTVPHMAAPQFFEAREAHAMASESRLRRRCINGQNGKPLSHGFFMGSKAANQALAARDF
jgi:hypothetical protein